MPHFENSLYRLIIRGRSPVLELFKARSAPTKWLSLFLVGGFFFLLFVYGFFTGGIVLREPDICFLLAGGRWIVEHGQLPSVDPFSYTTHFYHKPYVIEKWLTEIVFFLIWKFSSVYGLLVFDNAVQIVSFTVIAARIVHLNNITDRKAMGLILLCTFGSLSHLSLRPEIFSFLFTAVILEMLTRIAKRQSHPLRLSLIYAASGFVIALLWCNLHTLFILAVLLPGLYGACAVIERFIPILAHRRIDWTVPLICLFAALGNLCNPYGIGLWSYLPCIFGGFAKDVHEMQPMGLAQLRDPLLFPYFAFVVVCVACFIRNGFRPITKPGDLFFRLLIPLAIEEGTRTLRSVPLASLLLLAGTAWLMQSKSGSITGNQNYAGERIFLLKPSMIILIFVFPVMGVLSASQVMPPDIPQSSNAFTSPEKAIEYISSHHIEGNLLNEAHFGNVMFWRLKNAPPVFIDSRYNLYGDQLITDHWTMILCRHGWEDLMKKYQIGWVFVGPTRPLVKELACDPHWQLLYADRVSCIYALKNQASLLRENATKRTEAGKSAIPN